MFGQVEQVHDAAGLRALLPRTADGARTILGITGAPGAGKSTIAAVIAAMDPVDHALVPMDGFHLADQALSKLGRLDRKGAPDTFDAHGYAALLERLERRPAETVWAPSFQRDLEQPLANALAVRPSQSLLVTEGNYLLLDAPGWREARESLDEVWFIDVDPGERRRRLVTRHMLFGRTRADAEQWVQRVDEPNAVLVDATRDRADRILDVTAWVLP